MANSKETKSKPAKLPVIKKGEPGYLFPQNFYVRDLIQGVLGIIDVAIEELRLKLKFAKQEVPKQGTFDKLKHWYRNLIWGKMNKYHNPSYHQNLLGALGAPSKKMEWTLQEYAILQEAADDLEKIDQRRLYLDDVLDDWLSALKMKIQNYMLTTANDFYQTPAAINKIYSIEKEKAPPKEKLSPAAKVVKDIKKDVEEIEVPVKKFPSLKSFRSGGWSDALGGWKRKRSSTPVSGAQTVPPNSEVTPSEVPVEPIKRQPRKPRLPTTRSPAGPPAVPPAVAPSQAPFIPPAEISTITDIDDEGVLQDIPTLGNAGDRTGFLSPPENPKARLKGKGKSKK